MKKLHKRTPFGVIAAITVAVVIATTSSVADDHVETQPKVATKVRIDLERAPANAPYKNAALSVEQRTEDLLSRMTLEEKVMQLQALWKSRAEIETDDGAPIVDKFADYLSLGIGQVARPAENKDPFSPNKLPGQTQTFVNAVQKFLVEQTRLGIPAIMHEEALHGHAGRNATSFPQAIALASTWDPELLKEVYRVSGAEVAVRGATQVLTPILDVARDPRWGRFEETMGEDPYLVAEMGAAGIIGFQGEPDKAIEPGRVIATLKHLAGHGEPQGGQNIAPTPVGERTLREIFLFPFEVAVKVAKARSVMASYNEIDGIPSHSNKELLDDILRKEWGFDGVVVSDYYAIDELLTRHKLTENRAEAAALALKAGVDVEMPEGDIFKSIPEALKMGLIKQSDIDTAVKRVLREKFAMGLFENPYAPDVNADEFVGNQKHRDLALKAAEEAIILLKNDGTLPLAKEKIRRLAVIGPHADEVLLGGYSDVPKQTVSIVQGLEAYLGDDAKVVYEKGTLITVEHREAAADSKAANTRSKERWNDDEVHVATAKDKKGLQKRAIKAAKKSDAVLLVLGDNEATSREAWAESHPGDRTSLGLFGDQKELADAVIATGKPVVLLLLNGRPASIPELAKTAPAILEGWYLGQETGTAVANVLFGDVNPSGKMPVSVARSVGHIPVFYNHKGTSKRGYAFDDNSPLYAFGHGLSYTSFDYSDVVLDTKQAGIGQTVVASVNVKNTGDRAGAEVVQLYINDPIASIPRPVLELKGFKKVMLEPGETKTVSFTMNVNQFAFYDRDMNLSVEPGKIVLKVGSASDDIRSEAELEITGNKRALRNSERRYLTKTKVTP